MKRALLGTAEGLVKDRLLIIDEILELGFILALWLATVF